MWALRQPQTCLPRFSAALNARVSQFHTTRPTYSTSVKPPLAFCFDIDGVLIRGPKVLPAARRALSILEGDNPFNCRIPYILLTNGGGVSEEVRCQKLTKQLGFSIETDQYVQAHTILKSLAHKYAETPVLILGGKLDTLRRVAQDYGFGQAYTTLDVLAWNPSVWPFHTLTEEEKATAKVIDFGRIKFAAAFVFHDPRDWALDSDHATLLQGQILCDLIQSDGIIGGPYLDPRRNHNPVEVVFCNPDIIWKSDFEQPRLGQGSFKAAFQGVFKALAGYNYPHVQFGKPTQATYAFAEQALAKRLRKMYGVQTALPQIYMIGDNPESDIAGANAAKWSSVLVRTGVYDPRQGPPSHVPKHEAEDVEEAVQWAIDQARLSQATSIAY